MHSIYIIFIFLLLKSYSCLCDEYISTKLCSYIVGIFFFLYMLFLNKNLFYVTLKEEKIMILVFLIYKKIIIKSKFE
jgi:hypothetical protein